MYNFKKRSKSKSSDYEEINKNFYIADKASTDKNENNHLIYYFFIMLPILFMFLLLYPCMDYLILYFFKANFLDPLLVLSKEFNYTYFLNTQFICGQDFFNLFSNNDQNTLKKINFIFNYILKNY